jgi:hypothetical protein
MTRRVPVMRPFTSPQSLETPSHAVYYSEFLDHGSSAFNHLVEPLMGITRVKLHKCRTA